MPSPRRRSFLRRAVAALAAASGSALAGCSFLDGEAPRRRTTFGVPDRAEPTETTAEGTVRSGTVSVPPPGPPTYRRWLPAPSALPELDGDGSNDGRDGSDDDPYQVVEVVDARRIRELGGGVPPSFDRHRRLGKVGLDYFGVGFDRVDRVVRATTRLARVAVVEAPLDRASVAATLSDAGYGRVGTEDGHRMFARDDGPRAAAVGDGAVAWASGDPDDAGRRTVLETVRAVLDARAGRVPRYHEADRAFARLSDLVGTPPVAWIPRGDLYFGGRSADGVFEGFEGLGVANAFDREATYRQVVLTFDRAPDPVEVRREVRERFMVGALVTTASAIETSVDGRVARLAVRVDDDRYEETFGPPDDLTYPQTTWGFDHAEDGGETTVTVTHEAGDEVPAETLEVTSQDRTLVAFSDRHDTVAPGDSVTVTLVTGDVPASRTVRVVWQGKPGTGRTVLQGYAVPEPTP